MKIMLPAPCPPTTRDTLTLTNEELNTALAAVALYRAAKFAELDRLTAKNLDGARSSQVCAAPHFVAGKSDADEPVFVATFQPETIEGQILSAGSLLMQLTVEAMRRNLAKSARSDAPGSESPVQAEEVGPLRRICLLCGHPLAGHAALRNGEIESIETYRCGVAMGGGLAHAWCARGAVAHDLTGKPDDSGYHPDEGHPAYPDGYDAVQQGQEADAARRRKQ